MRTLSHIERSACDHHFQPSRPRRRWTGPVAAALVAATAVLAPAPARAEGPVDATGKGITGGAFLGAETVMIVTAAIGAKSWWPYVVFGAVGAGGGAVGGYFVEQASVAEPSLYMLAGGMALIVPTLVAVLNATAYDPVDDEDEGGDAPSDGTPGTDAEGTISVEGSRAPLPTGLIDIYSADATAVRLGVPAVAVRPSFTPVEVAKYGVEQHTEVHVPVIAGSF